jgi:phospholipase C
MTSASSSSPIKHVVVLMFENRSYDNVLGWLYGKGSPYEAPAGQQDLDGLYETDGSAKALSNEHGGTTVPIANASSATVGGISVSGTTIPPVDPGEQFGDIAQQILTLPGKPDKTPYATPPYTGGGALMGGFANNYASFAQKGGGSVSDVMNYLTPGQMPVTAFLANQFAVSDQWFASVPTQTYANRLFAFCAAPGIVESDGSAMSVVDDKDYKVHLISPLTPMKSMLDLPSVCLQLDTVLSQAASGVKAPYWKVYFHDLSFAVMTIPYVARQAQTPGTANVATFDHSDWATSVPRQLVAPKEGETWATTFVDDVKNGTLPPFAVVEPRYSRNFAPSGLPPNSNHPGSSSYLPGAAVSSANPPVDATGGELLLMETYNLLQQYGYLDSTLLIVTYDEHGGLYDHVAPPRATPPQTLLAATPPVAVPPAGTGDVVGQPNDPAVTGFGYDVFGVRVPAIVVSTNIAAGTTIRSSGPGTALPLPPPFDHTSIIRTVRDIFDLSAGGATSLSERELAAPSLSPFVDAAAGNPAPPFAGTIVANPSALLMHGHVLQDDIPPGIVLASAGPAWTLTAPTSLTLATDSETVTATVTPFDGEEGTNLFGFTITIAKPRHHGTYTGSLPISAACNGTPLSMNVPITFVVDL